ncbi:cell envelope integrity protein TolA [Candidatus Blochmanniella vafra]|nr:cell envelope integrity protein TolA [Candidatus Blochmannia vafer]
MHIIICLVLFNWVSFFKKKDTPSFIFKIFSDKENDNQVINHHPRQRSEQSDRFKITNTSSNIASSEKQSLHPTPALKKQRSEQSDRFKITNTSSNIASSEKQSLHPTPALKKQRSEQSDRFKITNTSSNIASSEKQSLHPTPALKKQRSEQSDRFKITNTSSNIASSEKQSLHPTPALKKQRSEQSDRFKITNTSSNIASSEKQSLHPTPALKKQRSTTAKKLLAHPPLHNTNIHSSDSNKLEILLNNILISNDKYIQNNKNFQSLFIKKNNAVEIRNNEINLYKNLIIQSIQQKFYNVTDYSGKKCDLKIQLDPNGKVISVTSISGDWMLSKAATIAVQLANFPKPPNVYVYNVFKNIILSFTP